METWKIRQGVPKMSATVNFKNRLPYPQIRMYRVDLLVVFPRVYISSELLGNEFVNHILIKRTSDPIIIFLMKGER